MLKLDDKLKTPRLFISHAWEDKTLVQRLEARLMATGAEIWVDHSEIRVGDNLPIRISKALEWCNTLLLLWSDAASRSQWVEREWASAFSSEKVIIPCLLDNTQLPGLLKSNVCLDFRNIEQGVVQLLEALNLAQQSVAPAPTDPIRQVAQVLRTHLTSSSVPTRRKLLQILSLGNLWHLFHDKILLPIKSRAAEIGKHTRIFFKKPRTKQFIFFLASVLLGAIASAIAIYLSFAPYFSSQVVKITSISGRVSDANDLPLEGVRIHVENADLADILTKKGGFYKFNVVELTEAQLTFSLSGYHTATKLVKLVDKQMQVDVRLNPSTVPKTVEPDTPQLQDIKYGGVTTISGRVTDEDGAPLDGVRIDVKDADLGTLNKTDGTYKLVVSDLAEARLTFSHKDYETVTKVVKLTGKRVQVDVRLKSSRVQIKMTDFKSQAYIKGKVTGLDPARYALYKIVAYVMNERWYIHLSAENTPGRGFAMIDEKGNWELQTQWGGRQAYKVAFLLVPRDAYVPPTVRLLEGQPPESPLLAAVRCDDRYLIITAPQGIGPTFTY